MFSSIKATHAHQRKCLHRNALEMFVMLLTSDAELLKKLTRLLGSQLLGTGSDFCYANRLLM